MPGIGPHRTPSPFRAPEVSLGSMDAQAAANVVTAAADIALIIDDDGVIRDLAFGDVDLAPSAYQSWVGRAWVDTVAPDSQGKVRRILEDARESAVVLSREINHRGAGGEELPVRYSAVRLGEEGRLLAMGRDLRAIAALQQQLVSAQQAMEREYARLRHAETRYRLLFQIASEAVLIVDAATHKVVEANPAAGNLLSDPPSRVVGRELSKLFHPDGWPAVQTLLATVRVAGWAEDVRGRLANDATEALISASLFRQDAGSLFLIRMTPADGGGRREDSESKLVDVVRKLPDAFVVIGSDRRVLAANPAFLDLVQLATEQQVSREPLDQWLGRPGVDLGILIANVKEHGFVRNFASVVRGQFGADEEVEVSGVSARYGDDDCFGFMIRPATARFPLDASGRRELPHSVEQLTGLVGRVPLKEIVRETTDVIESLCIQAALEVSGDNRASAAQMLGLSRQSLYAKLRRLGIGEQDGSGEAG